MLAKAFCVLGFLAVLSGRSLYAAQLNVELGDTKQIWTTEQLLARPDQQTVTVTKDEVFHRRMQYRAVPLLALLPGLRSDERLKFVASDGFSVDIAAKLILNRVGAHAWLAIEDPHRPWPMVPGGKDSPGPFYVVWTQPQAAGIGDEEWPYKLVRIARTEDIALRFPATAPAPNVPAGSPIRRGYAVFQRTCFACHTLNGQGDARMGPDLNLPFSPTEYWRADMLRRFIRNPQTVRRWSEGKMQGFPTQADLSDADLDAVLAYLGYMAMHKVAQ